MNASFRPDPDSTKNDKVLASKTDFSASGFGIDISLPFHKYFELKGVFIYGANLNNANLFTIAGSGSKNDKGNDDRVNMGIWLNVTSKISDHFQIVLGYGKDENQTSRLDKNIRSNTVIYGDLIFPISNGFSLALEAQNIATKMQGKKLNSAMVINLAGKIAF